MADWLDKEGAKAVAVLATATIRVLGREAPVVVSLQRLLHDRTRRSYDLACASFDTLDAETINAYCAGLKGENFFYDAQTHQRLFSLPLYVRRALAADGPAF